MEVRFDHESDGSIYFDEFSGLVLDVHWLQQVSSSHHPGLFVLHHDSFGAVRQLLCLLLHFEGRKEVFEAQVQVRLNC